MLIENPDEQAALLLADWEIDHWARVYVRLNLLREGMTFEDFLRAAPKVREDAEKRSALFLDQLRRTKQRDAQLQADIDAGERYALSLRDHLEIKRMTTGFSARGNGQRIEKLRHRRFPRSRRAFIKTEER